MSKKPADNSLLFQQNGIPPLGATVSLALQHLVAMIVGCVTPAIIVANTIGMPQDDRVLLIQSSLVISALTTLILLFPIGSKKGGFRFGSGLPMILAISFAYVPSMTAIAARSGSVATIAGAMMVGGIVALIVGLFIDKIRVLFPPLITGTVVFTIGLSLYPTAINYMAGGTSYTPEFVASKGLSEALIYGSWQNWAIAFLTLAIVTFLNFKAKGICKLASLLIGMVCGYIVAALCGMVSFADISTASWFALPRFLPFGIEFDPAACVAIGVLFAINSIQAIGDFTATTVGGMNREPTDQELKGGIVAYGVTNSIFAFFGGLPTATYSQNVGIVATTKVINRTVFALAAGFLLLAGICPKFSAVLTTIPQAVLGGATITVFSTIAMTGIKLITTKKLDARSTTVVGLAAALGVGVTQASASLNMLPESFVMVFGKSPVVVATIVAVFLNVVLPKSKDEDA